MCRPIDVEHIARIVHEANRAYCESIGDYSQAPWEHAEAWQKDAARIGVQFHLNFPDSSPRESHELWWACKLADGWTYGEQKDPEKKTHPCMVPYEELPPAQQFKDKLFATIVAAYSAS